MKKNKRMHSTIWNWDVNGSVSGWNQVFSVSEPFTNPGSGTGSDFNSELAGRGLIWRFQLWLQLAFRWWFRNVRERHMESIDLIQIIPPNTHPHSNALLKKSNKIQKLHQIHKAQRKVIEPRSKNWKQRTGMGESYHLGLWKRHSGRTRSGRCEGKVFCSNAAGRLDSWWNLGRSCLRRSLWGI